MTTGKRIDLGEPKWYYMAFDVRTFLLEGERLFVAGQVGPFGANHLLRRELWDLSRQKMIRREDREQRIGGHADKPNVWADKHWIYLGPEGSTRDKSLSSRRWSWDDGREEEAAGSTLLAQVGPIQRTAFRPFGSQVDRNTRWMILGDQDSLRLRSLHDHVECRLSGILKARAADQISEVTGIMDSQETVLALSYRRASRDQDGPLAQRATEVGLWKVATGDRLATLPNDRSIVGFDPSGKWLLTHETTSGDTLITAVQSGQDVHRIHRAPIQTGDLAGAVIAPSDDRLAFTRRGLLYLWDAIGDRPIAVQRGTEHSGDIRCLAQNASAGIVATGGIDGLIILRDRTSGRFLKMLDGHDSAIAGLSWHPEGTCLASASPSRSGPRQNDLAVPTVIVWDLGNDKPNWTYRDPVAGAGIDTFKFVGGTHLVVGMSDGRILSLDATTGRVIATTRTDPSGIRSIDSSLDGKRTLILNGRGDVELRDANSLSLLRRWEAGADVQTAAFLNDSVVVTGGRTIRLHGAESGSALMTYEVADRSHPLALDRTGKSPDSLCRPGKRRPSPRSQRPDAAG